MKALSLALLLSGCAAGLTFGATSLGVGTGALLGNDLTDLGDDGVEAAYAPPVLGGFDATFFASDEPSFGGGENAFNVFDNLVGGGNDKWCCGTAFPQIVGATFAAPIQLTHFTLAAANDTPGRDPTVWQIQGSNDTTTGLDGTWTNIFSNAGGSAWGPRLEVVRWDEGADFATPAAYTSLRLKVDATSLTGGAFFQLAEVEFFGEVIPEPSSSVLLGLVGFVFAFRRRR